MKKKDQPIQFSDIYIAKPCHENWEQMSGTERGRFCASCEKEVFDFRDGDVERLQQVWRSNRGQMCGRFQVNDLAKLPQKSPIGFHLPIFVRKNISRIAFGFWVFTGMQNAFAKPEVQFITGDLGFIESQCDTSLGMEAQGFAHTIWYPEEEKRQHLHPQLETEKEPKPEKEEETETDKEIPQKAPIIPILNRMPALHKKRQKESEKEKHKKLPWR